MVRVGSVVRLKYVKGQWLVVEYDDAPGGADWLRHVGLRKVCSPQNVRKHAGDPYYENAKVRDASGREVVLGETYVSQSLEDVLRVVRF